MYSLVAWIAYNLRSFGHVSLVRLPLALALFASESSCQLDWKIELDFLFSSLLLLFCLSASPHVSLELLRGLGKGALQCKCQPYAPIYQATLSFLPGFPRKILTWMFDYG